MKNLKIRINKLNGSSIILVLVISTILLVFAGFLMSIKTKATKAIHSCSTEQKIIIEFQNYVDYILANGKSDDYEPQNVDGWKFGTYTWGGFDVLTGTYDSLDISKAFMIGKSSNDDNALLLQDEKLLEMKNGSSIQGDVVIPSGKVRSYNTSVKPIKGNIRSFYVENQLDVNKLGEELLRRLNRTINNVRGNSTGKGENNNSFFKNTRIIRLSGNVELEGRFHGNIIILNDGRLTKISSKADIEDVIIVSDNVVVEEGFIGSFQLFSSGNITIEKDVNIRKPSLILQFIDSNADNHSGKVTIESDALVGADIVMASNDKNFNMTPFLSITEKANISGNIFVNGDIELKGLVEGFVCAKRLIVNDKGNIVFNVLDGGKIINPDVKSSALIHDNGSLFTIKRLF